ncbi:MAG TPA: hypothetical protein VE988_10425 [Gemmataceae bacterium]|nr:hypothetical protein [Gemmataceae bacterium]
MADKSSQLVLDALGKAAVDPAGVPLFQQKTAAGLFAGTALARQAAQRCKEQDLLRVVRTESRGKAVQEVVAITPKGLEHLLGQSNPRQLLQDLVRAVEGRQQQLNEWIAAAKQAQTSMDALRNLASAALERLDNKQIPVDCTNAIVQCLATWSASNAAEDCPLPHLYRQLQGPTIGQFHDTLRRLHAEQRIHLHPWTGPLCEMPEPPLALMVGHEIAYYASFRT